MANISNHPNIISKDIKDIRAKITNLLQHQEITLYDFLAQENPHYANEAIEAMNTLLATWGDKEIPKEEDFKIKIHYLTQEIYALLIDIYQKETDSQNFRDLLNIIKGFLEATKRLDSQKENLLSVLERAKADLEFAQSQEFQDKLFLRFIPPNNEDKGLLNQFLRTANSYGYLYAYTSLNMFISRQLGQFFTLAYKFGFMTKAKKEKIDEALQVVLVYLKNKGGFSNSLEIGDFTITSKGDTLQKSLNNGLCITIYDKTIYKKISFDFKPEGLFILIDDKMTISDSLIPYTEVIDTFEEFLNFLAKKEKLYQNKKQTNPIQQPLKDKQNKKELDKLKNFPLSSDEILRAMLANEKKTKDKV